MVLTLNPIRIDSFVSYTCKYVIIIIIFSTKASHHKSNIFWSRSVC